MSYISKIFFSSVWQKINWLVHSWKVRAQTWLFRVWILSCSLALSLCICLHLLFVSFFPSLFLCISLSTSISLCMFLSLYLSLFAPVLFSCWLHSQSGFRKTAIDNMSLKPPLTHECKEEKPKCCFSWKNFGWLCLSQILSSWPIIVVWGWRIWLLGRGEALLLVLPEAYVTGEWHFPLERGMLGRQK